MRWHGYAVPANEIKVIASNAAGIFDYVLRPHEDLSKKDVIIMEERKMWGIHTDDDALFVKENVIAIGWKEMGDLSLIAPDMESYREKFSKVYPDAKKQSVAVSANMPFRFVCEAQVGDYIVYSSKPKREVYIGVIEGNYFFNNNEQKYAHQRKVKWMKNIPRTAFSQGALSELGSFLTFFSIKNYSDEFLFALDKNFKPKEVADNEEEIIAITEEETKEKTKDYILKELSRNFKGYDFEGFVVDLLHAIGYRTPEKSPRGGDHGIDIIAYKDELPPRILVQVKSQDSNIKEETVASFRGVLKTGDYGLFITISNFTKNAEEYLAQNPIIRGIDGTQLADLIMENYDRLNEKHKRIILLKKVYIPVVDN